MMFEISTGIDGQIGKVFSVAGYDIARVSYRGRCVRIKFELVDIDSKTD